MKARSYLLLVFIGFFSVSLGAQVSGSVFHDLNNSGTQNGVELGIAGITVRAFDGSGEVIGSPATTNSSGNYSISGGTGQLKVVFELPSYLYPSNGSPSNTNVQFLTAGGTANLGVFSPGNVGGATGDMVIFPCYINGDPLGGGTAATGDVLVGVPNNIGCGVSNTATLPGSLPSPTHYAYGSEMGTVWGVAYQRESKFLFTSSFLKRHSGLGPGSDGNGAHASGAIYKTDLSGVTPVNSYFFSLDQLGFPTQGSGAYSSANSVTTPSIINTNFVIGTNANRLLPASFTSPNTDPAAYHQIGRVSLGDIDISDDGTYLYVINLYDKKLYKIFINNPAVAPTASNVTSYNIPNPGCIDGEWMPWGVKFHNGKVYVGGVCNAENDPIADGAGNDPASMATRAKLISYVYEFDDATNSFNTVPVLTFPLNYLKGGAEGGFYPASGGGPENNYWGNWADSEIKPREYSEPILSDIEFTQDGSMILGFLDRVGHQKGYRNADPDDGSSPSTSERKYSAGDFVWAYPSGSGTWVAESGGDKDGPGPYTATANQMNNQGPGGGEFFYQDNIFGTGCTSSDGHDEISVGGVAVWWNGNSTFMTAFDPVGSFSGGVVGFNNTTGASLSTLRYSAFRNDGNPPFLGKAAGIGDVEMQSDPAPLEIGNLVFLDQGSGVSANDNNGRQDPGESGINNVTVTLMCTDATATYTATTTTNSNGNYFFRDNDASIIAGSFPVAGWNNSIRIIPRNASCKISLSATQTGPSGSVDFVPNPGSVNDLIDSDGVDNAGTVEHTFNSGFSGENNHTFDFGFGAASCQITVSSATPSACVPASNTYSLSVVVTHSNGPGGNITVQTSNGGSVTVAAGTSPQTITIPNLPANGATNIGVTAFFVNETTCTHNLNNAYNAPSSCAVGCSAGINTPTVYCFDNSTFSNNGDDWFSVSLTGTITNGSGNYVVKVGTYTSPSTPSGTIRNIVGNGLGGNPTFSANGTSTYILRIEDASDSNCFTTVVVGPVANCSNCPTPNCGNVTVQKN